MFPRNPRVRRWDGVAEIRPAAIASATGWEELAQDGIELKFAPGSYRIGDYWLIPARTATAAIEWPQENSKPAFLPPAGVLRAFARLATGLADAVAGRFVTTGFAGGDFVATRRAAVARPAAFALRRIGRVA